MLRVGLTGGIGTGKSTVAAMMRELGCRVFEADKIAHRFMEPGGVAYAEVVREFGRGVLAPDGRVDREKLAAIVFPDPPRLARLNAILHPLVLAAHDEDLTALARAEPHAIGVIEAALLIEAGYHKKVDVLVVTWCTPEQQLARLTQKDSGRGLTVEQARQRIALQMPLEEKRRLADEVIDCSGSIETTRQQVEALVTKLKRIDPSGYIRSRR